VAAGADELVVSVVVAVVAGVSSAVSGISFLLRACGASPSHRKRTGEKKKGDDRRALSRAQIIALIDLALVVGFTLRARSVFVREPSPTH